MSDWNSLAYNAAMNRLAFWKNELESAQRANDLPRAQDAARFIEEYGKLIADALATKPADSA